MLLLPGSEGESIQAKPYQAKRRRTSECTQASKTDHSRSSGKRACQPRSSVACIADVSCAKEGLHSIQPAFFSQ